MFSMYNMYLFKKYISSTYISCLVLIVQATAKFGIRWRCVKLSKHIYLFIKDNIIGSNGIGDWIEEVM